MATIKQEAAAFASIAITAVTTTLAAGEFAESAIVDNTTNKYLDALVGGKFVTGASHTAGDTVNVYAYANYDTGTSTDLTGSIGTGLDGADSEEVEGTDFAVENFVLLGVCVADQASKTFQFGMWSVAQAFGGVLPPKWGLIIENNGTGAMAAGSDVGYVGIHYTVA